MNSVEPLTQLPCPHPTLPQKFSAYWGAYPRVLRVLTLHQKLEPNRGMNFLGTRENLLFIKPEKPSKMISFSVYGNNSVTRISFFSLDEWDFRLRRKRIWKKRSKVFCYAGEMRHVATWPSTCLCHATLWHIDDSSWLVMRRITSLITRVKLREFWRITCVMLWFSPEALQLHSTSTISKSRIVGKLQRWYQFRPTMAETFSGRNDQ